MSIDTRSEFIVGRRYRVMCVRNVAHQLLDTIVPILGPLHEDKEHIGFDADHWHVDWRFVRPSVWSHNTCHDRPEHYGKVLGIVITADRVDGKPFESLRKCYRPMPVFPVKLPHAPCKFDLPEKRPDIEWMTSLENAYADKRIKPGCATCPHRGISLAGLPAVDGVVVCPGHGLAWNVNTGELVRRAGVKS